MSSLQLRLFWTVLVLLAVLFSRALLLDQITFDEDEVRSAMRAEGDSTAQIIAWQPTDWPPLYGLLLGGWRALTSAHPVILRLSSSFLFLLAAAVSYRVAYRLCWSERAALATLLAFSAFGYSIFLSTYLRPYALALALLPLMFWMMLRYFHRPTLWRALPLAALLAALMYTMYIAVIPILLIALYTLVVYRTRVGHWVVPVIFSMALYAPEIMHRMGIFENRVEAAATIHPTLPPLPDAILGVFHEFVGAGFPIWAALFTVGAVFVLWKERPLRAITLWGFGVSLSAPLVLYGLAAIPLVYFFVVRYSWWTLFTLALSIGIGAKYLPRVLWWGVGALMFGLMFIPAQQVDERYAPYPIESVFAWMSQRVEPGDALLIDPNFCWQGCPENKSEENKFAYYLNTFGDKLTVVTAPDGFRRVWYLLQDGWNDDATQAAIQQGRVAREFAGPWNFLVRLYEAPPDPVGVLFENGLRFHGIEFMQGDHALRNFIDLFEQDTVRLRLWWSADRPLDNEYSVSVQLLRGADHLLAAADGAPQLIQLDPASTDPLPTSMTQWQPGRLYIEERALTLPSLITETRPTLYLTVYQWWDGVRLSAPGVNEDRLLPLVKVTVWGW